MKWLIVVVIVAVMLVVKTLVVEEDLVLGAGKPSIFSFLSFFIENFN